jgi:hypothetical protein
MTPPSKENSAPQVREVVGVFSNVEDFGHAIDELQSSGIDRARLSILAGGSAVGENLAARGFRSVRNILDEPDLPRRALVAPEDIGAAQGALVSGLLYVGVGIGAAIAAGAARVPLVALMSGGGAVGATIGGFLAHRLGEQRATVIERRLAHGGLVLWVRVFTPQDEESVAEILKRRGGTEVHAHGATDVPSSA